MGRIAIFVALAGLAGLVAVSARPTVREVRTKQEFDKILAHHSLTGMPVVADFYSNSCGPCRMIAPAYQEIAKQNKKDAVFLKINVQSANVGVEIRSMPTFQFYAKGRKQQEFSGADEAGIRRTTAMLIAKSKKAKKVIEVNSKASFKKVLRDAAKLPVVVGFFSKESEECKGIYPRFKELAKEYHRKTVFIKVDVDAVAEIKEVAGVDSVPTFHVYEGGKKSEEITGADEQALHKAVNTAAESSGGGGDDEGGDDDGEGGGEKKPTKPKRPKKIARRPKSNLCEKVIILGGGPAGLSAAIYAARAGLHPIVLAPKVGGQLSSTKEVENYPGMIESEGGIILSEMHEQALLYDAGFEEDLAVAIDLTSQPFKVSTNDTTYMTRTLIVATGADSRWLGVKGEEDYKTQGVSSCATCDGFLFKGKPVVVVGGGDTAMEDSLVLARTSSAVTLIHRRDTFRASKILQDRVLTNKKITVMWDSEVKEFEGKNDRLSTVVVNNLKTNEETRIDVDGAFVAIGHDPNTNLFKNVLEMDENGYLETKGKSTYTSIDGVFACGDVADHVYRQAVTSAGTGAMAALDAERWISANGFDKEEQPILYALPEGFEKWRVKQMKEAMKERKLSSKGCVEKPDYIKKLTKWQTKFLKKQAAAGIEISADGTQCKDPPCGTA